MHLSNAREICSWWQPIAGLRGTKSGGKTSTPNNEYGPGRGLEPACSMHASQRTALNHFWDGQVLQQSHPSNMETKCTSEEMTYVNFSKTMIFKVITCVAPLNILIHGCVYFWGRAFTNLNLVVHSHNISDKVPTLSLGHIYIKELDVL